MPSEDISIFQRTGAGGASRSTAPSLLGLQNGEIMAQRGQGTCPRSHSKPVVEQGLTSCPSLPSLCCQPKGLSHAPPSWLAHLWVPGLSPHSSHSTVSAPDPPGGVLLGGERALQLNDVELPLKDAVAEGDLGREKKQRRRGRVEGCSTGDPTKRQNWGEAGRHSRHFEGTESLPLRLKPH